MKAVTIIIGRNRGDKAMNAQLWGDFQFEVLTLLARLGNYFRTVYGMGQMDGAIEENATIFGSVHEQNVNQLGRMLQYCARTYGQDGILLIVGDAEYVKADVGGSL